MPLRRHLASLLFAAPSVAFAADSEAKAVLWMMVFVVAVTGVIFCIFLLAENDKSQPAGARVKKDQLCEETMASLLAEMGLSTALSREHKDKYITAIDAFQASLSAMEQTAEVQQKAFMLEGVKENVTIAFAVMQHFSALNRNLKKRIKYNDYGKMVEDNRWEEAAEFLDSIDIKLEHHSLDKAIGIVITYAEAVEESKSALGFDPESLPTDGLEFEHWVANALTKFGWDAQVTQGSGDQGLDVLAKKDGVSVAVQCKLYSSNVGNKAVQEVIAAKGLFSTDYACVVSNAGYTASAKELAESQKVRLLSHYDLPRFDELFLG